MRHAINVVVEIGESGRPVLESILVETVEGGDHVVAASPGLAVGFAAGDVIRVDSQGRYSVVSRGGNLCVWIFGEAHVLVSMDRAIEDAVQRLAGRIDGSDTPLRVLTVPLKANGFPAIERELNQLAEANATVEWYFGNVYDPGDGVTPLDWWLGGERA